MSQPKVLIPLAPGFEEIEAVTVIDVLRRAGAEVVVADLGTSPVEGSHGISMASDVTLDALEPASFDMVVLPGGMPGSAHLRDDERVRAAVRTIRDAGGWTAAICAAPIALSAAGVTREHRATSYPSFAEQIDCTDYSEERVVVDGKLITSRGPGTALEFSLELVSLLFDEAKAQELGAAMLVAGSS